jgi:hypothetical protein
VAWADYFRAKGPGQRASHDRFKPRRPPPFALAAILTLALGIGANTAIFTVVNATLLQRLPVPDRGRLVYVQREKNGGLFRVWGTWV